MIKYVYDLWHRYFGPDLGRALSKFEKAKAMAENNKERAAKVAANFKTLIGE